MSRSPPKTRLQPFKNKKSSQVNETSHRLTNVSTPCKEIYLCLFLQFREHLLCFLLRRLHQLPPHKTKRTLISEKIEEQQEAQAAQKDTDEKKEQMARYRQSNDQDTVSLSKEAEAYMISLSEKS